MPPMNGAPAVPDSAEWSEAAVAPREHKATRFRRVPPPDAIAANKAFLNGSNDQQDGDMDAAPTDQKTSKRWQLRSSGEYGLPGWAAVLALLAIAGVGALIDQVNGSTVRGGFNWALVLASLVAIVLVRRRQMFPVVIAPPLVYFVASVGMLYIHSGGLKDRTVLINSAANWLVYGFPAIAGATAVVLVIAGIRMMIRR